MKKRYLQDIGRANAHYSKDELNGIFKSIRDEMINQFLEEYLKNIVRHL